MDGIIALIKGYGDIFYLDKEKDCTASESILLQLVDVWQKERDIKYAQENYFHKFFSGLSNERIGDICEKLALRSWTKFPEFTAKYLRKPEDNVRLAEEIMDTRPKIAYECFNSAEDYSCHGVLALKIAHEDPGLAWDILREHGDKEQLGDFIAYMLDVEKKFLEYEAKEEDEDIDDDEDESIEDVRDIEILFQAAAYFKARFSDDPNCNDYYETARNYLFMSGESYEITRALEDVGDKEGIFIHAKRNIDNGKPNIIDAIEVFNALKYRGKEYKEAVNNLVRRWPNSINDWENQLREKLDLDKAFVVECAQKACSAEKEKPYKYPFISLIEQYGEREKLMIAFNYYSDKDNINYDIKKAYTLLIKSGLANEKKNAEVREILFKEKGTDLERWTFDNDLKGAQDFIDRFCGQDPNKIYKWAVHIKDKARITKTRDILMKKITSPGRLYGIFKYEKDQEGMDMVLDNVSKDVGIGIDVLKKYIAKKEN
jgi:hypothetical protein